MTEADRVNPYAPSAEISEVDVPLPVPPPEPASLAGTAIRWVFVCGLSAIPSFLLGLAVTDGQHIAAMLIGIATFAFVYTVLDYRTASRPWRQVPMIRRTLRIAYGTRVAISLMVPVGGILDLYCGVLALGITEILSGEGFTMGNPPSGATGFLRVVFTTLVQGVLMNIVLAAYGLLILGIHVLISWILSGARARRSDSP